MLTPTPIYGLDIETDTALDGLNPLVSSVVAAALAAPGGVQVWLGAEVEILAGLDQALGAKPPGVIATWNGCAFDLPFLADRARWAKITMSLRLESDPSIQVRSSLPGHSGGYRASWGSHGHLDVCSAWHTLPGQAGLPRGLKAVAARFGLDAIRVNRTEIHLLTEGEISRYVASDAEVTRQLAQMNWRRLSHFVDPPVGVRST